MGGVQQLNRFAGIAVGIYFAGVIVYLLNTAVVPITQAGEWRTVIDVIAVACYLIGGLPLIYIALQELGCVNTSSTAEEKRKIHATCVALFLVLGHIAMIAGMLDPTLLGTNAEVSKEMPMVHSH